MTKKELLLGNEAIARGAYEAGAKVSSAYPGTPSTEMSEALVKYRDDLYAEWAPNEKVALEVAIGASIAGVRSMASMKHVGLNVAADPLFTASYTGVNGGLVIVVADDPGIYSSQNEQDTRSLAIAAKVPVLEPSDSQEAKDFTKLAFDLSEEYDTPIILRTTSRLSHSQSMVSLEERLDFEDIEYEKNPQKYVMVPANASQRHPIVNENLNRLSKDSANMEDLNKVELNDKSIGFITSGIAYNYVKEALPQASILKLGLVNPISEDLIRDFASEVDRLIIFEELDPVIERQVKAWGIECEGKELFPYEGEYSSNMLKEVLNIEDIKYSKEEVAPRPPVLCPGCPHRSVFTVMNKLKLHGAGDIGCYTLGVGQPLSVIDTTICMGASISTLHGMEKAKSQEFTKDWVAIIGDSTFFHTGINSLVNMVYNKSQATVLILDNSTTAMTGHQDNPATGTDLFGEISQAIDIEQVCRGLGISNVYKINSFDLETLEQTLRKTRESKDLDVIIAESPCALLPGVGSRDRYYVNSSKCRSCGVCMKSGCPALYADEDGIVSIDSNQCSSCGLCFNLCPFDAIIDSDLENID